MVRKALHPVAIAVVLAVLTFVAFHGVLGSSFVHYDDDRYVTDNPHVQRGLTVESVRWAFTTTAAANWHPVTWLSHMLDVTLFDLDAGKHHGSSLLLHVANVVLLFLLLRRMTGATWRSAYVAALFAVHPLHVESVAWIAERKDVLSTLFWLLTTAAWLRYVESRKPAFYAAMLVLYAAGLMAKPMLVTLPFTLLLLELWPLRRDIELAASVREKGPLFALSVASCIVTFVAQRAGGALQGFEDLSLAERVANAPWAAVLYLYKTFVPLRLAFFYPHPHLQLASTPVLVALLLLAGATTLVVSLRKRASYLTFGWFWYLGTLVPVLGLVQVGGQAMADRYTYVPLIGIFVAITWEGARILDHFTHKKWMIACAVIGPFVLLRMTVPQVRTWTDDLTLFDHAVNVTRDNWLAHNNLGLALFDRGRTDEAIVHYRKAQRIAPGSRMVLGNLALALATQGDDQDAIDTYEQALAIDPEDPVLHFQLARALARTGRADEALSEYTDALRLRPAYPEAHDNLANLLAARGRTAEAIGHYEEALRLQPDNAIARYNLGNSLLETNRIEDAVRQLSESVRLRPDFAEARNSLGVAYLREGRAAEADAQLTEAVRLRPDLEGARRNLEEARAGR